MAEEPAASSIGSFSFLTFLTHSSQYMRLCKRRSPPHIRHVPARLGLEADFVEEDKRLKDIRPALRLLCVSGVVIRMILGFEDASILAIFSTTGATRFAQIGDVSARV
jgi:hypothetical protein